MADHGALFKAPLVRALLDNRKTQTRRSNHLEKLRRFGRISEFGPSDTPGYDWHFRDKDARWHDLRHAELLRFLPWHVGDRLWVREAHYLTDDGDESYAVFAQDEQGVRQLRETISAMQRQYGLSDEWAAPHLKLRPSIHLPRWASRMTLTVTDVRVQRLQDITLADELAEGCPVDPDYRDTSADQSGPPMVKTGPGQWQSPRAWYHQLWNAINGPCAWDANPWVVAYSFTVEPRNIDTPRVHT